MKYYNYVRIIALLFAFPFIVVTASMGQDQHETKNYPLKDFRKIYLEGAYHVYLIQGDEPSLEIKASDKEVYDYIKVENNESTLNLKITKNHFDFNRITLYITVRDLEKIIIQGGVKLKTKGYLKLKDFYLQVDGGANVEMDLKAQTVQLLGQGGVLFELNGEAKLLDVRLEGAGHINASELQADTVKIKIEGVGTCSVYAVKELNANLQGVGKVIYRGNPVVNKSIEGLGTVSKD
jgi:hypothetical protein